MWQQGSVIPESWPWWRRGDSFCKGGCVKMMVIGKTGIVAIVTAEMKTKPHMLLQYRKMIYPLRAELKGP